MLTVEALKSLGASTQEGLARCLNNETFYLKVVRMAEGDSQAAFEAAHALKGAIGNVALTPLYEPISALTELLRGKTGPVDCGDLPQRIKAQYESFRSLID